jgi:16S rRNA (cytosine967-C5)-methyltransferase
MSATKAFHKGLVEIQDEGSQLIAHLCQVQPGMRVLDFCAGGGGKTLGLAAAMGGKGIIYAMDNDSRRLEKGRRRYRKADIHNVEVRSLEDEKNRKWLRRQKGAMDIVLVDAPCSSSGTWRRNPDLRWNNYGPSLEEIKISQAEILERVADKVKPGGRLVYATCSLFAEENEEQVEAFLTKHPDFTLINVCEAWPDGVESCPVPGPYMRLTPKDHQTDGFFTAILQKNN